MTAIDVDEANEWYSSSDGVLFNKAKTKLLQYPCGKSGGYDIPNSVDSIGVYSFDFCESLTSVTMPNSVTSIGYHAFYGCTALTSMSMENSATSNAKSLGRKLAEASTTGTTIGGGAFAECTELETAIISDNVTSIGDQAFKNDAKLKAIYMYPTTMPTFGTDCFSGIADDHAIYVPNGTYSDYKASDIGSYNIVGTDLTDIGDVETIEDSVAKEYFSIDGKRLAKLRKGLNIVKYNDGRIQKVLVK